MLTTASVALPAVSVSSQLQDATITDQLVERWKVVVLKASSGDKQSSWLTPVARRVKAESLVPTWPIRG